LVEYIKDEIEILEVWIFINKLVIETNQRIVHQLQAPLPAKAPAPAKAQAQPPQNTANTVLESSHAEADTRTAVQNGLQATVSGQTPLRNSVVRSPEVASPTGPRKASSKRGLKTNTRVLRGATDEGGPRKTPPPPTNRLIFVHPGLPRGSEEVTEEGSRESLGSTFNFPVERKNVQAEFSAEQEKVIQMERVTNTTAKEKHDMFQTWRKMNDRFKDSGVLKCDQKRWLEIRHKSIRRIRNCIKICFDKDENEFFGQPIPLPFASNLFFQCPRQGRCIGGQVSNGAIPSRLQTKAPRVANHSPPAGTRNKTFPQDQSAREDFLTLQNMLKDLEIRLSSDPQAKRNVYHIWREIKAFAHKASLNNHERDWVESRRKAVERVDNCIQDCFDGDDSAFFRQGTPLPLRLNVLYKCTCRESHLENDDTRQLRDEFEVVKNKIVKMEKCWSKQAENKKALYDAWKDAQRFSGSVKSHGEEWLERRESAIEAIHICQQTCWDGDINALLQLPTRWPHIPERRLYTCVCEDYQKKPSAIERRAEPTCPNRSCAVEGDFQTRGLKTCRGEFAMHQQTSKKLNITKAEVDLERAGASNRNEEEDEEEEEELPRPDNVRNRARNRHANSESDDDSTYSETNVLHV